MAYRQVARTTAAYQEALDQLLLPMVLRDLLGREWNCAPGEKVVRTLWQNGSDGKPLGREVHVLAGNDPDPTCIFYELLKDAIEHRCRFFERPLDAAPGEPPDVNLSYLEWWQYVRLNERHNLAMAIKPYLEDRVAHWRFIYAPAAPPDSDGASPTMERPAQPESATAADESSVAVKEPPPNDISAMDSLTRIKFEAGLAQAEVTLNQELEDQGPSLEIAQKYVTSATLTLARCILTPNCAEPYEKIQRAYNFAEWFAAKTMQTAWVWICVFSEMKESGKLAKYNRDGGIEDGETKGMSDAEIREWHGCLCGVAHEALDDFVPEFWKNRLKYLSNIASGGTPPSPRSKLRSSVTNSWQS